MSYLISSVQISKEKDFITKIKTMTIYQKMMKVLESKKNEWIPMVKLGCMNNPGGKVSDLNFKFRMDNCMWRIVNRVVNHSKSYARKISYYILVTDLRRAKKRLTEEEIEKYHKKFMV